MRIFDIRRLGDLVYQSPHRGQAEIAVVIPLYNYAGTIIAALDSVVNQDLSDLAVVIVDDASTDNGAELAVSFLQDHADRFAQARLIRHHRNQGLTMSRNSGIAWSTEPLLFMLDADNRLKRPALSRLLEALHCSGAAFAYSQLVLFGAQDGIGVADIWDPQRLARGNYIDAMALIRRDALSAVGGYAVLANEYGWEDYDLWCAFAEAGLEGVFLPELLCEYRIDPASMLRSRTNLNLPVLYSEMCLRHPRLFRHVVEAGQLPPEIRVR